MSASSLDNTYVRRAIRVGITLPIVLALALHFGPEASAGYAAFGVVASLSLADFGGTTRRRAGAYLTLGTIGLLNIVIGTLCSKPIALGIAAAFVVGTCTRLVAVFGGYWGMGAISALLAFVLAVTVPAGVDDLPERLGGWGFGCAAATFVAVLLWPRHERQDFAALAAKAARTIASLVRARAAGSSDTADLVETAVANTDAVRRWVTSTPYRPAGPAASDRALVEMTRALERSAHVSSRLATPIDADVGASALHASTAQLFDDSAQLLTGSMPAGFVESAAAASTDRDQFLERIDAWIAGLDTAAPADLRRLETAFDSLLMSHLAQEFARASALTVGQGDDAAMAAAIGDSPTSTGWLRAAVAILAAQASPRSAWFRECIRTGVGFAAAVGIALASGLAHGAWIVFGTLAVLRASARSTSSTALRGMIGTLIGFGLSVILIEVVDGRSAVLWILLPVFAGGGAYAAGAWGPIWGQAGFTLLVVTLFELLLPGDRAVALVRLEDFAVGAAVSVVVGLVLWPRGAGTALRDGAAAFYRSVARLLESVAASAVSGRRPDGFERELAAVDDDHRRVSQAFSLYLGESPAHLPRWGAWAPLLNVASYTSFGARRLARNLVSTTPSPFPDTAGQVAAWGADLAATLDRMGDAIQDQRDSEIERPHDPLVSDPELIEDLASASGRVDVAHRVAELVWARCWMADLADMAERAAGSVGATADQAPGHSV